MSWNLRIGYDGFGREETAQETDNETAQGTDNETAQETRAMDKMRFGFDGFKREETTREKRASRVRVGFDGFKKEEEITVEKTAAETIEENRTTHAHPETSSTESSDNALVLIQNNAAAWDQKTTYVKPGLLGLLQSPRVAMYASVTMIGWYAFGYDQGVISSLLILPQFLEAFPMMAETDPQSGLWIGLMTSCIELGAIVGALLQGWMADKYSRKYTLSVSCTILTTGHIMQTAASSYAVLVVGRTVTGVGIGILTVVSGIYAAEISPPEIRGAVLVLLNVFSVVGLNSAYWIAYGTRQTLSSLSWRIPFMIPIFPSALVAILALLIPFTPRWLAMTGREEACLETISKLRNLPETDDRVQREWMEILAEVAFENRVTKERHPALVESKSFSNSLMLELAGWTDLFRPGCWRRTHVGTMIMIFQQWVGLSSVLYYAPTLLLTIGIDQQLALIIAGLFYVVALVAVLPGPWAMDAIGRRPLLLGGAVVAAITLGIVAVLSGLYENDWELHRAAGWGAVAMLFIYAMNFSLTFNPVGNSVPSEIFPNSLRAKGVAFTTVVNWLMGFIVSLITPPLLNSAGFALYTIFAGVAVVSFVWLWFFLPETKGRTLEQMAHVFKDKIHEDDEARQREAAEEVFARHGYRLSPDSIQLPPARENFS